jgi:hypothetical protein
MAPDEAADNDSSAAMAAFKTTRSEPATLKCNLIDRDFHPYFSACF